MLSVVLTKPYTFSIEEKEIPACGPEEVLLKITQVGICGSDMQKYHGKHKHAKLPQVTGHECAAVVEAVGERAVERNPQPLKKGQRVTIFPHISCGECHFCRTGRANLCRKAIFAGLQRPGFFEAYTVMPAENVFPLPEGVSDDMAMLTEPAAVAVHALRLGDVKEGTKVVVIGAGTIGHLVTELSHGVGAKVLVAESLEKRGKIAMQVGADKVFGGAMEELGGAVKEFFGEDGAEVFVISRTVAKDLDTILRQVTEGATVVVVGNYKEPATVDWTLIQRRELTVKGSFRYTPEDFAQALAYLQQGLVDPEAIITHRFPITKMEDAFHLMDEDFRNVLKVALTFE